MDLEEAEAGKQGTLFSDLNYIWVTCWKVLPSLKWKALSPTVSPFWKCPHRHTEVWLLAMSISCSSSLSRLAITSYEHILTVLN